MRLPETLTAAQVEVVEELHNRDRKERAAGIRNDSSLKAIAPAVAELLYFLVVSRGARLIVEFGTSHGYSTIHLAAAAERTDGHVHSVDIMPEKAAQARANLERTELLHRVTLVVADGVEFAAKLPNAVDMVLVDYGVEAFAPAFDDLRRRMAPGCLLFVDGGPDGYWDAGPARQFRTRLEDDPSFLVLGLRIHREELLAAYLPAPVDVSA